MAENIIGSSVQIKTGESYGDAQGFIISSGADFTPGELYNGYDTNAPGVVSGATVMEGGTLYCLNAGGTTVLSNVTIEENGVFSMAIVKDKKNTIDGFTFNGGTVKGEIASAYVNNLVVSSGSLTMRNCMINGGTIYDGTFKNTSYKGTFANFVVSSGAATLSAKVFNGVTQYDGTLDLYKNNLTSGTDAVKLYGGTASLNNGGASAGFKNTVVSGGELTINANVQLTGTFTVGGTAHVVTTDGMLQNDALVWTFDLSNSVADNAVALVDNFSRIGGASYTVSVAIDQAAGDYKLAGEASSLSGTAFTLMIGGESAGTITVDGDAVEGSLATYTLTATDGNLMLNVTPAVLSPVMLTSGGKVVSGAETFTDKTLDGTEYDGMIVSGGVATNTTVRNGAGISVLCGTLNDTTLSGGYLTITEGTVAGVTFSGTATLTGGTVSDVVLADGAAATVDGSVINDLTFSGAASLTGGEVNGASVVSGAVATVANATINDVTVISGGALTLNEGSIVEGGTIVAATLKSVIINEGATVSGVIMSAGAGHTTAGSGAIIVSGAIQDCTVFGAHNGVHIYGVAENVTYAGGQQRVYGGGTAFGGTIKTSQLRVAGGGKIQGIMDINGGALDMMNGVIEGTVNLNNGNLQVGYKSGNVTIAKDAVINVFSNGSIRGSAGSPYANTTVSGAINLYGGRMVGTTMSAGDAFTFADTGSLNFELGGLTAIDEAYVASYNILNKTVEQVAASEAGTAFTITVNTDGTVGEYILFGDASEFSTREQSISVNDTFTLDLTNPMGYNDAVACRWYRLSKDDSDNVTFSVTAIGGEIAATTGKITEVFGGTLATATWDDSTSYSANKVYVGNENATQNTVLFIDNAGAVGADNTYVYGGAEGADMGGEADIRLYQGSIGAIMGGAQDAAHSVGAVDVQIGGGSTATTKVVYGGGQGSVDGTVAITTSKGAVVTGQVYGGALINTKDAVNAVTCGAVTLDLNGGTLASDVIGGACVRGGTAVTAHYENTVGAVTIDVDGASFSGGSAKCVYGGGWVTFNAKGNRGDSRDYVGGDVTINVNSDVAIGSANGRGIFGGSFAADRANALVGEVTINVTGGTVGNVFGGGWAQNGALSETGAVTINLTNATVNGAVYGGGAHSNVAVAGVSAETIVDQVNINVDGGTIGSIHAIGQTDGDTVTIDATVTVTGDAQITHLVGSGYNGYVQTGLDTVLNLDGFTGSVTNTLQDFGTVNVYGESAFTIGEAGTGVDDCFAWNFDLADRTGADAVLTWDGGSFGEDTQNAAFNIALSDATATDWTVCDLGNAETTAFQYVDFKLEIGGGEATDYTLGSRIGDIAGFEESVWADWELDYDDGKLAFSNYIA